MNEKLFWRRVNNLIKIINAIQDDIVYRTMWENKLKELMQRKDVYEWWFSNARVLQINQKTTSRRGISQKKMFSLQQRVKNGQIWEVLQSYLQTSCDKKLYKWLQGGVLVWQLVKWIVIINLIFWYAVLIENAQIYSRLYLL